MLKQFQINYNHCQKSTWMTCLQRSVQSSTSKLKRRHQRHKRRKAIIYFFLGNGHPIHLKWPQYQTCSCCATIVYSFPYDYRFLSPKSLSAVCFVLSAISILWKPVLRMLNCRSTTSRGYCNQHGYCNRADSARYGTVLTGFTRQILTEPFRAEPYRIVLARKNCVV